MASLPAYLVRRDSWSIYICARCQIGVRYSDLIQHLKNKHQEPQSIVRQIATELVRQVEPQIPFILKTPDPELPLLHQYFLCKLCPRTTGYICQTFPSLRAHLRTVHQIQPESQRGRPSNTVRSNIKPEYWANTCCQKVFNSGTRHLIQVPCVEHQITDSRTTHIVSSTLLNTSVLSEKVRLAKAEAYDAIQTSDHYSDDPWLRHTGWRDYLDSFDRTTLLSLVQQADKKIPSEVYLALFVR